MLPSFALGVVLALGAVEVRAWEAPGCPSAALQARLRDVAASEPVQVSVRRRGAGFVGVVEVTRDGRPRSRAIEAQSCDELVEALALGAALAAAPVDRSPEPAAPVPGVAPAATGPAEASTEPALPRRRAAAKRSSPAPAPKPARGAPSAPRPLPDDAARASAEGAPDGVAAASGATSGGRRDETAARASSARDAPEPPSDAPPRIAELAQERSPEPSPTAEPPAAEAAAAPEPSPRFEVGARGVVVLAPAPVPAFGASATAALLPLDGALRVELSLQHARTAIVALGPSSVRFSLTVARLGVCSPALALGRVEARGCGSLAGGLVWAQGFSSSAIAEPREAWEPWLDAAATARVTVRLGAGVRLELHGGPTFPITRHTFVFDAPYVRIHTVGPVGLEAGVGLVLAR